MLVVRGADVGLDAGDVWPAETQPVRRMFPCRTNFATTGSLAGLLPTPRRVITDLSAPGLTSHLNLRIGRIGKA